LLLDVFSGEIIQGIKIPKQSSKCTTRTEQLENKNSCLLICYFSDKLVGARPCVKYLGVELDQTLSGESIGKRVIQISNSRLEFFYRQSNFLSSSARRMLVSALVQSHFDYACSS